MNNPELDNFITTYKFEYPIQYFQYKYNFLKRTFDHERHQSIELLYLYCQLGESMIVNLASLTDNSLKFFEYMFAQGEELEVIREQIKNSANLRKNLLVQLFNAKSSSRIKSYSDRLSQIVNDYEFINSFLNSYKHGLRATAAHVKVERILQGAPVDSDDWTTLCATDVEVKCYRRKFIQKSKVYDVFEDTYIFNSENIFENINFCIKLIERLISYDKSSIRMPLFRPGFGLSRESKKLFSVNRP